MNFALKNSCKYEFKDNNEKSCSWSRKTDSHKIDFLAVWLRKGHADSVRVNMLFIAEWPSDLISLTLSLFWRFMTVRCSISLCPSTRNFIKNFDWEKIGGVWWWISRGGVPCCSISHTLTLKKLFCEFRSAMGLAENYWILFKRVYHSYVRLNHIRTNNIS